MYVMIKYTYNLYRNKSVVKEKVDYTKGRILFNYTLIIFIFFNYLSNNYNYIIFPIIYSLGKDVKIVFIIMSISIIVTKKFEM